MNKNNKFVITINRELGSGGRTVGRKLAELLGVKYYDKAIVQGLTEKLDREIRSDCRRDRTFKSAGETILVE